MTKPPPAPDPAPDPAPTKATHYEILNLPYPPPRDLPKPALKLAYHKALLSHHPDKSHPSVSPSTNTKEGEKSTYTIDQITTAYKTLSSPSLRTEYDRSLSVAQSRQKNKDVFYTGLEVVDLEDLSEDGNEDGGVWFRGCRCGDERGFLVTEEDLERGVDAENEGKGTTGRGEVVVGCRGCSLWVRVVFAVQDDDEEGEGGREMG